MPCAGRADGLDDEGGAACARLPLCSSSSSSSWSLSPQAKGPTVARALALAIAVVIVIFVVVVVVVVECHGCEGRRTRGAAAAGFVK